MSDNQWVRTSGTGPGVNMAHARKVVPLDDGTVLVIWQESGLGEVFNAEDSRRILAWLAEQNVPAIAPG